MATTTGDNGGQSGTGAGTETATETTATAFDPKSLPAEAQEWMRRQVAEADQKARITSKANAAKEAEAALTAKLATALGLAPDQATDPDKLAAQLTESQRELRVAKVERAIERAARAAGADDDLVTAVLLRDRKVGSLDPMADDFANQIGEMVKAAVAANPRLLLGKPPSAPAAQGGATSTAMAGPGAADAGAGNTTDPNNMTVEEMRKKFFGK